MRVTIKGGTARHDEPSLCASCRYATIVRGVRSRDEIVECRRLSDRHNRITFPVTFCNGYIDRTHPSINDMEDIAWVLRSDPHKKQVGFVRASELKPEERHVLPDEWY